MQRWALVRHEDVGGVRLVRGYLDHPPVVTEADEDLLTDAKRRLAFGADDDGTAPLEPEGVWLLVPPAAGLVGDDWTWDGKQFAPPVRP